MVNKEHFSKNESIIEKNVEFTTEKPTHGRKTFIGIADLVNRQFRHKNDCFLLELELRSIKTHFEQWLQLPREGKETHQQRAYGEWPKYETNYFTFGNFDWNLSVFPWGDIPQREGRSLVFLTRQTSFDHLCRTRYRITLGAGDRVMDSDVIEQILDTSGTGPPYDVGYNVLSLTSGKSRLRIKIELFSVSAISEIILCPFGRSKNRVNLYDRDKQAWMLEADVLSKKNLTLKMYYSDIHNVPRKFSRYVCWSTQIVPVRGHSKPIIAVEAPYSNYYAQTDTDEGYIMKTDIPVADLNGADSMWMDAEERRMVIQVEWMDSHLLFHSSYHKLDDTVTCHKHQQWREIMALQAENYALEKQLHSYQVSIARLDNAKSSPAAEEKTMVPNGRGPPNGSSETGTGAGSKVDALREMSRRWESGK